MIANNVPLVSIGILAYNHASFIEECIDSYIDSTYKNIEIVILDNGSEDNTYQVVLDLKLQDKYNSLIIERVENGLSVNAGFNWLLKKSIGDLIIFTSADDYTFIDRVSKQVDGFLKNEKLKAYYALPKFFEDKEGDRFFFESPLKTPYEMLLNNIEKNGLEWARNYYTIDFQPYYMIGIFCLQASMFDREFILNFNGFDENALADDIIFNFRLFNAINDLDQLKLTSERMIGYRQHSNQVHKNFLRQSRLLPEALEKYAPASMRKEVLSEAYFFQVEVGFGCYTKQYFWLTTKYFIKSIFIKFSKQKIIRYFVLVKRDYPWTTFILNSFYYLLSFINKFKRKLITFISGK